MWVPQVPFRNSKLTFLLQPALSKGSRVMFIVTASPDAIDAPETLVSLGFGTRARNAQLGRERSVSMVGSMATPCRTTSPFRTTTGAASPQAPRPVTPGRATSPFRATTPGGSRGASPFRAALPGGGGSSKRPATGGGGKHPPAKRRSLVEVNRNELPSSTA